MFVYDNSIINLIPTVQCDVGSYIAYILLLYVSKPIFQFITNSLRSIVDFFPFYVFIEDTCRFMNNPDAARSIISPLNVTGYSAIDTVLNTMRFLFLGYFNTPLKSVIDYSYYWYVGLCGFHPSHIGATSSVILLLFSYSLLEIRHG